MAHQKQTAAEVLEEASQRIVTGSHALVLSLLAEGVDTIFGYPGGAIMPTYDALYDYRDVLHHVLVRHEQGAGHAAQGYARLQNRAGVCMVTSGPGATNLMTPICDALLDSTPIVCIIGQVHNALLGTDAFQEADVIGMTMPITKWNYQITRADEVAEVVAKAFYIAQTGRPGPVVLDFTRTAQMQLMTKPYEYKKCETMVSYKPRIVPKPDQIKAAAELINRAKKPYILAGHGILISKAEEELRAFAEKTGIPVATTLLGMSAIDADHPNYVGWLGMHGNYGPNVLTNECDVLIAIGMRFDDRVTGDLSKFATQAKVVHIEIDPAEIDKNMKAAAPVVGDAKEALKALFPLVDQKTYPEWREEFRKYDAIEDLKISQKTLFHDGEHIKMGEVVHMLSNLTKGEAVTVTDVGQHQMIANRYYRYKKHNSIVTSGGAGTMGFALPAALGAKVGAPDRQVVAIIGDGGFQMTIQELA
ncbi:MAG: biosynthetic-type acetolactate synthase large subunit, partial [Siphonobacter sp.]